MDPPKPPLDDTSLGIRHAAPDKESEEFELVTRALWRRFVGESDPSLGRYQVRRRIASGGLGTVFLAWDPKLGRRVAIKLLRPKADTGTPAAQARFLREMRALAHINHPNVLEIFDLGTFDVGALDALPTAWGYFMVTEHVEAETLEQWAANRKHTSAEVLEVYEAAGSGLAAAHAAGLVHRDFKPANALVGDDGRVRVIDFGLAQANLVSTSDGTLDHDSIDNLRLTQTGTVVGTPRYMSPEQIDGGTLGPETDQYSFCQSLAEALAGRRVFTQPSWREVVGAKRSGPPLRFPGIRARVWQVLRRGLEPEPSRRYPSMRALLDALARARRRRNRAAVLIGGAAVGVLMAAAGQVEGRPCDAEAAQRTLAWNDGARDRIERARSVDGGALGLDTAKRVRTQLDAWSASWVATYVAACDRRNSDAEFERSLTCLEQRRAALLPVIEILRDSGEAVTLRAVDLARRLPEPGPCLSQDAGGEPPLPAYATSVLARVQALYELGRSEDAAVIVDELLASYDGEQPKRVRLQALYMRGGVRLSDETAARADFMDAYYGSVTAGQDTIAGRAAISLAILAGYNGDLSLAREWLAHAQTSLRRVSDDDERWNLHADAARARASILHHNQDAGSGIPIARAILDDGRPVEDREELWRELGDMYRATQQIDEARGAFEESLRLVQVAYGPAHPRQASALAGLSTLRARAGDYAGARNMMERAVRIAEGTERGRSAAHAANLISLGQLHGFLQEFKASERACRNASEILTSVFASQRTRAIAWACLSDALSGLDQPAEAEAFLAKGIDVLEAAGQTGTTLGEVLGRLAKLQLSRGDASLALATTARALDVPGLSAATRAGLRGVRGCALTQQGRAHEALGDLRHAYLVRAGERGPSEGFDGRPPPRGRVAAARDYAVALVAVGEPERASEVSARGLAIAREFGLDIPAELQAIADNVSQLD